VRGHWRKRWRGPAQAASPEVVIGVEFRLKENLWRLVYSMKSGGPE